MEEHSYMAKNKDGKVFGFPEQKPRRNEKTGCWEVDGPEIIDRNENGVGGRVNYCELPETCWNDDIRSLTWEDEPLELEKVSLCLA